ncbi:MAG TPA: multiheme c-type cytochrome, partial [Clostridia bacterium]|nr:multiheme c-type cytochrome [Clostridia bacterium]
MRILTPWLRWRGVFLLLALVLGGGWVSVKAASSRAAGVRQEFALCSSCSGCHEHCYQQHLGSMHSKSFSNPVFLAQYTQEVLPLARYSADGWRDARSCTACHAPVAHKLSRARLVVPDPTTAASSGVTCDFCHTITGFKGEQAQNANYIVEPGPIKYGPFHTRTDWHHQYSALQTRSEFCAICHSVSNRYGLNIKSTYAEWQESSYAREGIQCQDCHMSIEGFLTQGRPVHASGVAAFMSLGSAPVRFKLYTHRFQGARSQSQIEGAMQLDFQDLPQRVTPGSVLNLNLL